MPWLKDDYRVFYDNYWIGQYYVYDDDTEAYTNFLDENHQLMPQCRKLHLDKNYSGGKPIKALTSLVNEEYRVPGTRKIIYRDGLLRLERIPQETDERYWVYRRDAEKGSPAYSKENHDAPHYEGDKTPEGMREWASWYAFNKMDDGTYEAALDEAWWWGGGHNDGGTIHVDIPEEWFNLPYEEFLKKVVTLASASHYGFTAEMLLKKKGLKEFFGFKE